MRLCVPESKLPEAMDADDIVQVHLKTKTKAKDIFWQQAKERDDAAVVGVGQELKMKLRERSVIDITNN